MQFVALKAPALSTASRCTILKRPGPPSVRVSMVRVNLKLRLLEGAPLADEWTTRPFMQDAGFNESWWLGPAKGPLVFCSFTNGAREEVARVQIKPHSMFGVAYPTYSRPAAGATEIDRLEVRADLRGQHLGHEVVDHLLVTFAPPCIAVSLDDLSDRFWRSLSWTEHLHPDDRGAALFVQPD